MAIITDFQSVDGGSIPPTRSNTIKNTRTKVLVFFIVVKIEKGNRRVFQKSKRFYFFENPGSGGKFFLCNHGKIWGKRIPPTLFWVGGIELEAKLF